MRLGIPVLLALLIAAPAQAATVSGDSPLVITDAAAEVNTLTVAKTDFGLLITDTTADLVNTASACESVNARQVRCQGVFGVVSVDLGELNDQLDVVDTFLTLDLAGGAGNDSIDISDAKSVANDATFRLSGSDGDDELQGSDEDDVLSGGPGADVLRGGRGGDTADYTDHADDIVVDLTREGGQGADGEADVLTDIESVFGGLGNDVIVGDAGANFLRGNQGRDRIRGGAGDDQLEGDGEPVEDDTVLGGDDVRGGAGDDSIAVARGSVARGDHGADNIRSALSRVFGGQGNDFLAGAMGTTRCGAGRDIASLGEAPDFIARDCERISSFEQNELLIGALHLRGESFAVRLICGGDASYCRGRIRIRGRGGHRFRVGANRSKEVLLPRARGRVRIIIDRIADFGPIRYDTRL